MGVEVSTDYAAITERQQKTWAAGNFATVATTLAIVGERICEAADVSAGEKVLDVACGSGNAAIAAARRFAEVTGIDFVPALLDDAHRRFAVEGLAARFISGDAQHLPFPDGEFDVVLSTFGSMFAPDQERTAAEMLRVTRPGGHIAIAAWTPESWIGEKFRITSGYVPPASGLKPAFRWGTEEGLRELFGASASEIQATRREFIFRYLSAAHYVEFFRVNYGPTLRAFEGLDDDRREALKRDLMLALEKRNTSTGATLRVPGEYLEAVIHKAS